jgi:hypothetical protein
MELRQRSISRKPAVRRRRAQPFSQVTRFSFPVSKVIRRLDVGKQIQARKNLRMISRGVAMTGATKSNDPNSNERRWKSIARRCRSLVNRMEHPSAADSASMGASLTSRTEADPFAIGVQRSFQRTSPRAGPCEAIENPRPDVGGGIQERLRLPGFPRRYQQAKPIPRKPSGEPAMRIPGVGGEWWIGRQWPNHCRQPNPCRCLCQRRGRAGLADSFPNANRMARSRNFWRCAAVNLFIRGRYFSTTKAPGVFFSVLFLKTFTRPLSHHRGRMSTWGLL